MSIKERKNVKLFNYSKSSVSVPTEKGGKIFEPASETAPFADFFDWDQIEYIYNRSSAIQSGLIEPPIEDRKEFYEALTMVDWESKLILHDTVDDIINHPTIANMEKILAVTSILVIERIRGRMTNLINNGVGMDSRFIDIVNGRFGEISRGIRKSEILIKPIALNVNVDELKTQNETLMQQMAEMQNKLEALMKSQDKSTSGDEQPDPEKKSAGRPKTK